MKEEKSRQGNMSYPLQNFHIPMIYILSLGMEAGEEEGREKQRKKNERKPKNQKPGKHILIY